MIFLHLESFKNSQNIIKLLF